MPVYVCFRGDCDHIALEKAGAFAVEDALGRNWICYQSSRQSLSEPDTEEERQAFRDMFALQGAAHEQGLSKEGTSMSEIDCDNSEELKIKLAEREIREQRETEAKQAREEAKRRGEIVMPKVVKYSIVWWEPHNKDMDTYCIHLDMENGNGASMNIESLPRLQMMVHLLKSFKHVTYDTDNQSLIFGPEQPGEGSEQKPAS